MNPIQAAITGSNEIMFAVLSTSYPGSSVLPVILWKVFWHSIQRVWHRTGFCGFDFGICIADPYTHAQCLSGAQAK